MTTLISLCKPDSKYDLKNNSVKASTKIVQWGFIAKKSWLIQKFCKQQLHSRMLTTFLNGSFEVSGWKINCNRNYEFYSFSTKVSFWRSKLMRQTNEKMKATLTIVNLVDISIFPVLSIGSMIFWSPRNTVANEIQPGS